MKLFGIRGEHYSADCSLHVTSVYFWHILFYPYLLPILLVNASPYKTGNVLKANITARSRNRRCSGREIRNTRVGTLIVVTIYLQLIQNRYMFRSFTVLHCSHQHCVQPVASDVEVVGCL